MAKKIFSMVIAAITAAALCVTAMAGSSPHGSVDILTQAKYWREFKAETTYSSGADEIFACSRLCSLQWCFYYCVHKILPKKFAPNQNNHVKM